MSRRDAPSSDVEVVELGGDPAPAAGESGEEPSARAGAGRARLLFGALAALVIAGAVALVVTRGSSEPAAQAPASSPGVEFSAPSLPPGRTECNDPGGCVFSSQHRPTSGVAAAIAAQFPQVSDQTASLLIDPRSGQARSQFVTARTPGGLRLTVAVSYDGIEFRTDPTYHRDTARPPTLYFDRHTFEGWSVEITIGGTAAAQGYVKQGLALLSDGRLFS